MSSQMNKACINADKCGVIECYHRHEHENDEDCNKLFLSNKVIKCPRCVPIILQEEDNGV